MNRITQTIAASALALGVLAAFAPTALAAGTNEATCRTQAGITGKLANATVAEIIALGDCEIGIRDTSINAGLTRLAGMQKVSDATKATLTANLQSTLSALATIKTSLDADTSTTTALANRKNIFDSVRVYALVMPQTWIAAAADRAQTIGASLTTLNGELTTKVNALPAGATQTQDLALLADATAKVTDATTNATAAVNEVASLKPDNGVKATQTANAGYISDARAKMKTAQSDLKTAQSDLKSVRKSLKS